MSFYFAFIKEDFTDKEIEDILSGVQLEYELRDNISDKYPLKTFSELYGETQQHGYDESYYYLLITVFNQTQLNQLLENHTYLLEHLIMIICEEDDLNVEENEGKEDEIILDFSVLDNYDLQNLKFVRLIYSDVSGLLGFINCKNMLYFEAINIFTEIEDIIVVRNFNQLVYCALCETKIKYINPLMSLRSLKHLYIWSNNIITIPDNIKQLNNIEVLKLNNNPIENCSEETFEWLMEKNAL